MILPMTVLSWEGTSGIGVIVPVGSFWAEVGKAVRGMGGVLSWYTGGDTPGCSVPELCRRPGSLGMKALNLYLELDAWQLTLEFLPGGIP